jgi:uncharacterized protein YecE (DUF72 family)
MEFGKTSSEVLSAGKFPLPPDDPHTLPVLERAGQTESCHVYTGCAKWGRKEWVGKIYPRGTKESDFLRVYAQHFNSIELNATFYKTPSFRQAEEWKSKVRPGFVFSPKIPNSISHIHRLKNTTERMERFLQGIAGFRENLGPLFLMLHPEMGPESLPAVEAFIPTIPKEMKLFVELRHPDWYKNTDAFHNVFHLLERHGAGAVITDACGRRDCLHMRLTIPEAFIRFAGNDLHPTDYSRVDDWIQRIRVWKRCGLKRVYFFMHQNEEVHSPVLAQYAVRQFNKHCDAGLPEPMFVS